MVERCLLSICGVSIYSLILLFVKKCGVNDSKFNIDFAS
jgi:hypothetical protein